MRYIISIMRDRRQAAITRQRHELRSAFESEDPRLAGDLLSGRLSGSVLRDRELAGIALKFFFEHRKRDNAGRVISLLPDELLHSFVGTFDTTKYVFGVIGWRPYVHLRESWGLISRIFRHYGCDKNWDAVLEGYVSSTVPFGLKVCGCRELPSGLRNELFQRMDKNNILEAMGSLNVHNLEKAAVLGLPCIGEEFAAKALEGIGWQRTGFHVREAISVAEMLPDHLLESPQVGAVLERASRVLAER
ncbi:MAG: hypothetical protein WC490_01790 [Candidatus Margulisiibacteriota bacterium]